jgi:hypothetical protein
MKVAVCYIGDIDKLGDNLFHHHISFELYKHNVDYYIYTWDSEDNRKEIERMKRIENIPKSIEINLRSNSSSSKIKEDANSLMELVHDTYYLLTQVKKNRDYDVILLLSSKIILEKQIYLDKYDIKNINILNKIYYENNGIERYGMTSTDKKKIFDIEFNNLCMFTSVDNIYKYIEIYDNLINGKERDNETIDNEIIDNETIDNETIDNKYNKLIEANGLLINRINIESYVKRDQKKDEKICLIIAFYFGSRTANVSEHNLIEIQKRFFKKYKNNLSRIVFAISEDGRTTIDIEEKDGITYFYKPNMGLSFGSWQMVSNYYQENYDYYIFSEDDYLFIKDNFDKILLEEYKEKNKNDKVDYLVTWKSLRTRLISTIGIISSDALKKYDYLRNIKWTMDKDDGMMKFLDTFLIKPISKEYSGFPYWGFILDRWDVWLFDYIPGESSEEYLKRAIVAPVQLMDNNDNIKDLKLYSNTWEIEYHCMNKIGLDYNMQLMKKLFFKSEPRINLIIGTYGAKYNSEVKDNILRLNLRILNELNPAITTITIMKPRINSEHEEIQGYYNLDDLELGNIKHKIRIIECENIGISYGQYFVGMYGDPSYDYYILIEDDYVILNETFEKEFIKEFSKNEEDSFLCSFIYRNRFWDLIDGINKINDDDLNKLKEKLIKYDVTKVCNIPDMALSILSNKTLNKIMAKLSLDNILDIFSVKFDKLYIHQVLFGYILSGSDVKIYDTKEKFMNIFYETAPKDIYLCNFENYVINWKEKQYKNEKFESPLFVPIQILHNKKLMDELQIMKIYLSDENDFFRKLNRLNNITLF